MPFSDVKQVKPLVMDVPITGYMYETGVGETSKHFAFSLGLVKVNSTSTGTFLVEKCSTIRLKSRLTRRFG
jgi:hypothetical protein